MHELDALKTGHGTDTLVPDGPAASRPTLGEQARTAPGHELAAARAEAG